MDYSGEWYLSVNSGDNAAFGIITSDGRVDLAGTTTISAGSWYFIAGVYDGTQMSVYVNGVLDETANQSGTLGDTSINLKIGLLGAAGEYFHGIIDEPMVFSRALTAEELKRIYEATRAVHR